MWHAGETGGQTAPWGSSCSEHVAVSLMAIVLELFWCLATFCLLQGLKYLVGEAGSILRPKPQAAGPGGKPPFANVSLADETCLCAEFPPGAGIDGKPGYWVCTLSSREAGTGREWVHRGESRRV